MAQCDEPTRYTQSCVETVTDQDGKTWVCLGLRQENDPNTEDWISFSIGDAWALGVDLMRQVINYASTNHVGI